MTKIHGGRRLCAAIAAVATVVALSTPAVAYAADDDNVVPDLAFRACLNGPNYLGQTPADTPISVAQLEGVGGFDDHGSLTCDDPAISSIDGAQYLTRITSLQLHNTAVSDLSPLSSLQSLYRLQMYGACELSGICYEVPNFAVLTGLPRLAVINLSDLGMTDADLATLSGLTKLTDLDIQVEPGITDVSPLADMVDLEHLRLSYANVEDIAPLAGLTKLALLDLRGNEVADLTGLGNMASLEELYLADNDISNVGPLSSLASLHYLEISGNEVSAIDALSSLTQLSELQASDNQISDLSPLAGVRALERLSVNENNVSSVAPLAELPALVRVDVAQNNLVDVSPFDGSALLTNGEFQAWRQTATLPVTTVGTFPFPVTSVAGDNVTLTVLSGPAVVDNGVRTITYTGAGEVVLAWENPAAVDYASGSFSGEATIQVTEPHVENVVPDDAFRACLNGVLGQSAESPITAAQLEGLDSSDGQIICTGLGIKSVEGAQYLTNYDDQLWLGDNQITDLSPLAGATKLTYLALDRNSITDLGPLAELGDLAFLNLDDNQVSDLVPLADVTKLQNLGISHNQISSVLPLAGLSNLEALTAWGNQISDVSPLAGLTNLYQLWLSDNEIADVSPLASLDKLVSLDLSGNHIFDLFVISGVPAVQAETDDSGCFYAWDETVTLPVVEEGTYPFPVLGSDRDPVSIRVVSGPAAVDNEAKTITYTGAGDVVLSWESDDKVNGAGDVAIYCYAHQGFAGTATVTATAAPAAIVTVTFDGNGGSTPLPTSTTTVEGEPVDELPAAPTREGYSFTGWNTAADGSGDAFDAFSVVAASLTVYAQWTPVEQEDPVDVPPVDNPPAEDPPVDNPPVDVPPVDDPPVADPPVEGLPTDVPPVDDPPADNPPAADSEASVATGGMMLGSLPFVGIAVMASGLLVLCGGLLRRRASSGRSLH